MRKTTAVLAGAVIGLCVSSGLFAEDNSADLFADVTSDSVSETAPESAASAFTLKFSGEHEFDYRAPAYLEDGNGDYDSAIKAPAFRNDVGVEIKDGNLKLVSRWGLDISPLSSDAQSPNESWAASALARPLENYVSWSPASYKLSFGYQIFSWGVADRKNPTDNLNPKDYTVGVNPDKIPVLAADVVWYPSDSLSIEGVAIPSKSVSEYPQDFAELVVEHSGAALLNSEVLYDSSTDPEDFVAGLKLNYTSPVVDLSLDYLYDLDQYYTPVITTVATGGSYPTPAYVMASVGLERKRIHRFGGDAKTTLGKFGLWLEGAYSLTENDGSDDYSVRKSKIEYTLGTDFNFGPNDTGYLNLQYIGAWTPDYDADFNGTANGSMLYSTQASAQEYYERAMVNLLGLETEGLMQGVTCNLKYELADAVVTPQITTVYMMPFQYDDSEETRYGALVLNPEVDFKPVDSFHIVLGADLYYAWHKVEGDDSVTLDTKTNAVGSYTPSNNVYLKVVYKWNADLKK